MCVWWGDGGGWQRWLDGPAKGEGLSMKRGVRLCGAWEGTRGRALHTSHRPLLARPTTLTASQAPSAMSLAALVGARTSLVAEERVQAAIDHLQLARRAYQRDCGGHVVHSAMARHERQYAFQAWFNDDRAMQQPWRGRRSRPCCVEGQPGRHTAGKRVGGRHDVLGLLTLTSGPNGCVGMGL